MPKRFQYLPILLLCLLPAVVRADKAAVTAAMGYGKLTYPLPPVGSYQLPPLGKAADGEVLDEQGKPQSLHTLLRNKYTLLSFMYSHCNDVNGCPLSAYVLYSIKAKMRDNPLLAAQLRLVSLSFDPERDTPAVMQSYAENFRYASQQGEWRFLTTASMDKLLPVLQAYGQDVQREMTVSGDPTGQYGHLLKVYLLDPELNIRNIYSVGFLHADILMNDLQTLLQADAGVPQTDHPNNADTLPKLSRPGDDKAGYEQESYTTRSLAVNTRPGQAADLLALSTTPPLGLPPLPIPADNPLTAEKISLGRQLFFDRRLSLNDTFSCAMCHIPEQGFTSNELATAVGLEGRSVRRNTPSLYNVGYAQALFHDGREQTLEQQVWSPLLAHNEMANPSIGQVLTKIRQIPAYPAQFKAAFPEEGLNMLTLGKALASYQRSLLSADSPFDRWHFDKDENALSASAIQGFRLFTGKAGCAACHTLGEKEALFTDHLLHNTGIGYQDSMGTNTATRTVQLAPGVFVEVDSQLINSVSEPKPNDLGLYEVTQNPADRWKYKTPGLRNVNLTAPYMHNGSLSTLEAVVQFYNAGGIANEGLDPRIRPLGLNEQEVAYLVDFLKSLQGSNVDTLVADAFAAPVGDLTPTDPHWSHEKQQP